MNEITQPPIAHPSRAEIEASLHTPRPKKKSPEEIQREKLKAAAKAWPGMMGQQRAARLEVATNQRAEIQRMLRVLTGEAGIEDRDTYVIGALFRAMAVAVEQGELKRQEESVNRPRYVEQCRDSHVPNPDRLCIVWEPQFDPDLPQSFSVVFEGVEYWIVSGPNWIDASTPIAEVERLCKKQIADDEITLVPPGGEVPEVSKYLKIARERALALHGFPKP